MAPQPQTSPVAGIPESTHVDMSRAVVGLVDRFCGLLPDGMPFNVVVVVNTPTGTVTLTPVLDRDVTLAILADAVTGLEDDSEEKRVPVGHDQ